jgi:hypothetical protein
MHNAKLYDMLARCGIEIAVQKRKAEHFRQQMLIGQKK